MHIYKHSLLKRFLLATVPLGVTALLGVSLPAQALDLNEALAIAYKRNPALKAQRADLRVLDEQFPQALSGFLPTADLRYGKSSSVSSSNNARYQASHPDTRSLNVSQPIFNGGGTIAATQVAKYRILAGRNNLQNAEQRLLNDAVVAYIDVVRTREVQRLSLNNEKVLEEQLKSTRERFDLGETTRTDVAQAESRLARARSDRISAEGQVIEGESGFHQIFEMDPPANMAIPAQLPLVPESLKKAMDIALSKNPTLIAAQYTKQASDMGIYRQVAELLPSADITGSISKEESLSSTRGRNFNERAVSLNVRVPLFQSGIEYSRVRAARSDAEGSQNRLEDAYNRVIDSVTSAWQQIVTAGATVESRGKTVESAKVALEGVRQEREIGSRTTLDVLDAEQELFIANVDLVTARRNRVVAVYNLLEAIGGLTAQQQVLKVEYYDPEAHYDSVKYKVIGF